MNRLVKNTFLPVLNAKFSLISKRFSSATASTTPLVLTEKIGRTFLIGINRPEQRNCVNHQTAKELVTAFETFMKDENSLAAVFYGVGGHFCAGYDLKEVSSVGSGVEDLIQSQPEGFRLLGPTGMKFNKPVIAAVEGYAVAGGLELALMCDVRIVDETAKFGVPLIDGGTVRLPKLIGLSRAMDMIVSGREVDAKTAMDWGLANHMVPTGAALGRAVEYAMTLEKFPQACMNADRRSAYYATFDAKGYEDALNYEWENGRPIISKESVAGATRFARGVGRHGSFNLNPTKTRG